MSEKHKTGLVISAHAADFVWRAGGAIALYASRGWKVRIVCLSLGERGESAKMWREPGMTLEKVTEARLAESRAAAELLGGEFVNLGLQDYPMRVPDETLFRLADMFRELQPEWVLTHSLEDPYNFDHPLAAHVTQEARIIAQAMGYRPDTRGDQADRCAASVPVRTAPDRAVQLEAGGAARYHPGLGEEEEGLRDHGGAGISVGLLHAGRDQSRRPGSAAAGS
jgi:LmbE family N-acetylglucosaminyl deacetylase